VMLVASSWIAVAALDRDLPLEQQTEAERREAEYQTLLRAASIRVRDAHAARESAPWYLALAARAAVRDAERELTHLQASPPPPTPMTPLAQRLLSELNRSGRDVGGAR